jgi:hypothetical protein
LQATRDWSSKNLADLIQAFLICLEMVIAAYLHMKAFSHREFIEDLEQKTRVVKALWDALNPRDIYIDLMNAPTEFQEHKKRTIEKKSRQSLNHLKDEFDDDIALIDVKTAKITSDTLKKDEEQDFVIE